MDLHYKLLQNIVDPKSGVPGLIVKPGEVIRFGDKDREIPLGQTVPFVAQADFMLNADAARVLGKVLGIPLKSKDPLLTIGEDGELATPQSSLGLDDDVNAWVADYFQFTFKVEGVETSPFRPFRRQRVDGNTYRTVYPWLQEINTLAVGGELLEIEVDIDVRKREPRKLVRALLTDHVMHAAFKEAKVKLRLDVDGNYQTATDLVGKKYWLDLRSDDDPDLRLAVEFTEVDE